MQTYISILRGINVGGHRKVKMDALKRLCADLKFENIRTDIQSGKIIFLSKIEDTNEISKIIKTNIKNVFGFDVPVITLTQTELEIIINSNPFLKDKTNEPEFFHITFLSEKLSKQKIELLKKLI